jgi:hypothetical protein
MSVLRIALAAAGAALALGGGAAFAAPSVMSMNRDAHGDLAAAAAHQCPKHVASDRDSHGDCVSKVADSKAAKPAEKVEASPEKGQDGHRDPATGAPSTSKPAAATGSLSSGGDQHGDAVSAAAKSCPSGTRRDHDAHGDCVSEVAGHH